MLIIENKKNANSADPDQIATTIYRKSLLFMERVMGIY